MPKPSLMPLFLPSEDSPMKLNGNQPSVVETMKSIDNNHLLQIQGIKIDLHKSGKQEKYSEHDVNKVLHMKQVSRQHPPVNRYLVFCYMSLCATASLAIIIGLCYVMICPRSFFGSDISTHVFQCDPYEKQ